LAQIFGGAVAVGVPAGYERDLLAWPAWSIEFHSRSRMQLRYANGNASVWISGLGGERSFAGTGPDGADAPKVDLEAKPIGQYLARYFYRL